MDIRSSLDGLKNLLGVSSPAPSTTQSKPVNAESATALTRDSATLSSAANEESDECSNGARRWHLRCVDLCRCFKDGGRDAERLLLAQPRWMENPKHNQ
jgi:hypothetical protein